MKETFCSEPSDLQIREAAYLLYVASGCKPGRDMENWLQAKRLLSTRSHALDTERLSSDELRIRFPLNAQASCVVTPHPFPLLHT